MRKAIKLLIFSLYIVFISGRNEQKPNVTARAYEYSNQQVEIVKIVSSEISIEVFKPISENENGFELNEFKSGLSNYSNNILTTISRLPELWEFKIENEKINSDKVEIINNNVPAVA